jgi:hypothetical protein
VDARWAVKRDVVRDFGEVFLGPPGQDDPHHALAWS